MVKKSTFIKMIARVSHICLMALMGVIGVSAAGMSQSLTFDLENVELKSVFQIVERSSEYRFLYHSDDISGVKVSKLHVLEGTIDDVMEQCLTSVPLTYEKEGNLVIIHKTAVENRAQQQPQQPQSSQITVSGRILGVQDGKAVPIAYASVQLPDMGISLASDAAGHYKISQLRPGSYKFRVSCLGFETLERTVEITRDIADLDFRLNESTFFMDEVVVTAQQSKAGAATASVISRTAMDHMQPTSLGDVMKMLPGQAPNKSTYLRESATFGVRGGSSLGTAVILDGVPLSNNANLQMMTAALGAQTPGGSGNKPTEGLDMRILGTDGLSSVEVIQGIASPEYGDILTGAVIANSKMGKEPLLLNFQTDQYMYGLSLSHGLALGRNGEKGNLNYSFDYANNNREPREGQDAFQRVNGRIRYGQTFGRWNTQFALNYILSRDNQNPSKADSLDYETIKRRDWEIRLSNEGVYDISRGWFKNLQYVASFSYKNRYNYYKDEVSNASVAYSQSLNDGAVLTSRPGLEIPGITNILPGDEDKRAWILPSEYTSVYHLYGEELYTYLKANLNFSGNIGKSTHHIVAGAEYINEGNKGKGKVFDPETPPWRSVYYDFGSQRERSFDEIPFINRIGAYVSENMTWGGFRLSAGLRYDYMWKFGGKLTPRLNASLDIIKETLTIRGGYGMSAKLPTLALLYPENAYFDFTNFDNTNVASIDDQQKLQIITTRVFDTKNADLKMATNEKIEFGLDLNIDQIKLSVTAYREKSGNNYSFSTMPDTYKSVDYITYKAVSYPSDPTQLPELEVNKEYQMLVNYTRPTNNNAYDNRGIEFVADFGRWHAIRTSFVLNGLYLRHKNYSNGYYYWYSNEGLTAGNYDTYPNVGVWDAIDVETSGVNFYESFRTNMMVIHNIPRLGFVFTLTTTVLWKERTWKEFDEELLAYPKYYIDRTTGEFLPFDKSMLGTAGFDKLDRTDYLTKTRDQRLRTWPPSVAMSINVTKEFRNALRVSFYANNMFNSKKWLQSNITFNRVERMAQEFSFGLKLTAILK